MQALAFAIAGGFGEFAGPVVQQGAEILPAVVVFGGDDVGVVGFEAGPFGVGRGGDGGLGSFPCAGGRSVERGGRAHAEEGHGAEEMSWLFLELFVPACGDYRGITILFSSLVRVGSLFVRMGF